MTGCRNIQDFTNVIKVLCKELRIKKEIIDPITMTGYIPKPFASDRDNVCMSKIHDFRIIMINSDFDAKMEIDREIFYDLLIKQGTECSYQPNKHAGINIKYKYKYKYEIELPQDKDSINNKKITEKGVGIDTITILVFGTGKIIITAAKKKDHIVKAYEFITKKIKENYDDILKTNDDEVMACADEVLKDINIEDFKNMLDD